MPGSNQRDRGALVALVAALVAIVLVAFFNQPIEHSTAGQQGKNVEQPQSDDVSRLVSDIREFDPWNDTYAQWLMALFGVAATIISWRAVVYVRDTLRATNKAVKAAEDAVAETRAIGRDQSRAYVHMKSIHWSESGNNFRFVCYVENSGETPCLRFNITAVMTISKPGAGSVQNRPVTDNAIGWSGLPGKEVYTCAVKAIPTIPIEHIVGRSIDDILIVSGQIEYQTFFGEWFRSEFSFMGTGRGAQYNRQSDGTRMSRTTVPIKVFERIPAPS